MHYLCVFNCNFSKRNEIKSFQKSLESGGAQKLQDSGDQGPILQNSISAENFLDTFPSSNFERISTHKQQIKIYECSGQKSWFLRYFKAI
jgi:hypothetical protein